MMWCSLGELQASGGLAPSAFLLVSWNAAAAGLREQAWASLEDEGPCGAEPSPDKAAELSQPTAEAGLAELPN